MYVTRSAAIRRSASAGSQRGMRTAREPSAAGTSSACTMPEMCMRGDGMSTVSPAPSPCTGPRLRASASSVRCECSAPFGSAVVPDV